MINKDICAEILIKFDEERIAYSTDEKKLFEASIDHTRFSSIPACVAYAKDCEEIAKILKIANNANCPVTVRGSGTGCAAGSVPFCGGLVLDLSAVNFIKIDPVARIAHVGAGAITAEVDKEARKHGLFYAPDPSSHKYSSIGGNIACNAGGLRAAKYGVTRENVLALTAYLADGEKILCGLPLKKFSVGMNLRDFFIGSEGTLGVVGEAWLKLLPAPKNRAVALALFEGDAKGFQAVEKIMRSNLTPSIFEFMDAETVDCVRRGEASLDLPAGHCALLAQFDTSDACELAKEFVKTLEELSNGSARAAADEDEIEKLWKVRRVASSAMYYLNNSKLSQDIVLPFEKVAEFFEYFKSLASGIKMSSPVFGHAADGNYHIHFMYDGKEQGARKRGLEAMDAAMKKVVELGGAVSGEHGIGALKAKYMPFQHGASELELMRKIKKVFDPKNILNRGKIYEEQNMSGIEPLKGIKLPWD